jgi:hypothetical protein
MYFLEDKEIQIREKQLLINQVEWIKNKQCYNCNNNN